MPLLRILRPVEIDAIPYAQDQVVLVDPPRSDDVLQQLHGAAVASASVWVEHSCRLETEFGGEPPWLGSVSA